MATRNRLSLAGQGGSALLDSLDAFKRKHVSQNKEIIHRNSELMRLNAELNKQVRDLQAEAVELRTDNARLTTAYNSVCAELQSCLLELEQCRSKASSSMNDKLRQALQLITSTADDALQTLAAESSIAYDDAGSDSALSHNEGDTILASSSLSNRDRQPPLVSSKPDLSLIDEASHEESFYKQSLPWYRPNSAPEDLQHPDSVLLPPSVVFSRPRRSSSTASLRPMLDEVYEESERSASTSPTCSPTAPSKVDNTRIFDSNITERRRSLMFNDNDDGMMPSMSLDDLSSSSSDCTIPNSPPSTSRYQNTHSALEQAVQDLSLADDKPDVLPKRKRTLSQTHQPAQSTSSSRAKEKEPTNAASSTVSSRARRRPSLSRPASQQSLRDSAQADDAPSSQPTLRKRNSASSLAASSASGSSNSKTTAAAPAPAATLTVKPRSDVRARSQSPNLPQDTDSEKTVDRAASASKRSSASSSTATKRSGSAASKTRLSSPSPIPPSNEDYAPMSPPPQVDMDGLVVKKRAAPVHQDMQPLAEESESQGRRSTSTLASSTSSSRIPSTEAPPTTQFDDSRAHTPAEEDDHETVGSRRARKSVNYALPNLRDKMRKPAGYNATASTTTKRSVSHSDVSRLSRQSDERSVLGDASNSLTLPRRKSSATLNANKEDVQPTGGSSRRPPHHRMASS